MMKPLVAGRGDFRKMAALISLRVQDYGAATKAVEKFFKWMSYHYCDLPDDLPERARSVASEELNRCFVRVYSGTFPFFSTEGRLVVTGYELFIWLVTLRLVLEAPGLVDILGHDVEAVSEQYQMLVTEWEAL